MHLFLIHSVCLNNRGKVVRAQEHRQTVCHLQIKATLLIAVLAPTLPPNQLPFYTNREADGAGHIITALIPLNLKL